MPRLNKKTVNKLIPIYADQFRVKNLTHFTFWIAKVTEGHIHRLGAVIKHGEDTVHFIANPLQVYAGWRNEVGYLLRRKQCRYGIIKRCNTINVSC